MNLSATQYISNAQAISVRPTTGFPFFHSSDHLRITSNNFFSFAFDCIFVQSDDWTLDSIFALNNDFLQELSELGSGKFEEPNSLSDRLSPFSTGTESENDHDFLSSQTSSLSTTMDTPMLSPHPNYSISSSSSDSGLSSDNIDL